MSIGADILPYSLSRFLPKGISGKVQKSLKIRLIIF
jgi:hypothetical protein